MAKIIDNLCSKQGKSSKNLQFIINSGFKSRAGFNGALLVAEITSYTPPNSEIICGRNVSTKVVCGIILFFEKKAMLKI